MIYSDLAKAVGNCIKDNRLAKHMTLEELAKAIGVTKATVQKYETGQIEKIGANKLKRIAEVLDIDMLRLSPEYYGSLSHWAEQNDKEATLKSLLDELYGESITLLIAQATQLTAEGRKKLLDRAGELLEVSRYNQTAQEVHADGMRERPEYYGFTETD